MCIAIRFSKNEFSDKEIAAAGLDTFGDEIKIAFAAKDPLLPVHYRGKNRLFKWGNKRLEKLPRTGYCKTESLKAGKWQWLTNGVWFHIRQGISGVTIKSPQQQTLHCYMLTKPSTHYFKIMTGSDRMPVLVNQIV